MSSHNDLYSSLIPYRLGDFLRMIAGRGCGHRLYHAGCQIYHLCAPSHHILRHPHRITARTASAIGYADYLYILVRVLRELAALLPDGLKAACAWALFECALTSDDTDLHHVN